MEGVMDQGISIADTLSLHRSETEWMLAGAAFLDAEYVIESCGWLDPAFITNENIRRYWQAVKDGKDPATASIETGIYMEVMKRVTRVNSQYDAPAFAGAIMDDHFLSKSAETLSRMAVAIAKREKDPLRELAQSIIDNAPEVGGKLPDAVDIGAEFQSSLDDVGDIVLPTGITPIDDKMGGLERQSLFILGGRPGMGKTTGGLQIATTNAKNGKRVIYFSLEMSRFDLFQRMACGRALVDWRLITSKTATPEQIERVKKAARDIMEELGACFLVDDNPMTTNEEIYRKVSQYRPDLIVVDHLLLVNQHERGKLNEVIRVGNTSRMGKVIAKKFNIPAVYLMQLNRDTEKRDNKRPQLSDLRASGDIEQDADIVAFLYRPDYYHEEETKATVVEAEIWLEKVRKGKSHVMAKTMLNLQEQRFYAVKTV